MYSEICQQRVAVYHDLNSRLEAFLLAGLTSTSEWVVWAEDAIGGRAFNLEICW